MRFHFRLPFAVLTLLSLAVVLALTPFARAEDEPSVEFYFTNSDPHLAQTDKLLSDARKNSQASASNEFRLTTKRARNASTSRKRNLRSRISAK
jgi:hypothetical protein